MNIDVANMVVNLGEQLQKVNWLDAGVTFTSVFLGAFLAHRFNLKLEMRKAKRQMRGDFCSLVSQIHLDFSEMIDFKKRYLDEIRKTYEEGNMNSFLVTKGFPCMSFILDIDKYIFLSDCNRCFLSELKIIKYNNNQLNNAWQDYMLAISDLADLLQNRDKDATKLMKEKFFKISVVINHLIPLPPLAEQKRIVAKIEELEPLVKQYGEVETELSTLNDSFPEQLKKSILQYAIQGKLIPQDVNDESAEVLYVKIQAEKQKLIKEGKIKKDKPLPPITTDEIPFDIPSTWKWVRLGSISNYSSVKKKISPNQIKPEMWSLDLEDIEKVTGRVLKKHFAKDRIIRGEKVCFTKGNILYNKLRPYLLKILIADDDGITTPELVPFNFYGDSYQQFFLWYLKSPYVDSIVNSESYGVKCQIVDYNIIEKMSPLITQKEVDAFHLQSDSSDFGEDPDEI